MQEQWKQIADFPKYEVSNTGLVRNSKGVILKPQANTKNNYFQILLWNNSKAKCCYIHRLVEEAFVAVEAFFLQAIMITSNNTSILIVYVIEYIYC